MTTVCSRPKSRAFSICFGFYFCFFATGGVSGIAIVISTVIVCQVSGLYRVGFASATLDQL
ncbi:MAG: hypothetical protein V4661_04045 [Pseudomonadota bacterium]